MGIQRKAGYGSTMNWLEKLCDRLTDLKTFTAPSTNQESPPVVAHRGAWDRRHLENTMASFVRAQELGLWGVELDVHFTKDQVAVVHHDPTLNRVLNVNAVIGDSNWDDLRNQTTQLARLSEVVALPKLHFMIEIKAPLSEAQQKQVLSDVQSLEPGRDFHLLTLDEELIFHHPRLPRETWILVGEFNLKELVEVCLEKKYGGVAGHYLLMNNYYVTQLHEAGMKVGTGFIPNANIYRREWARGIDWIFTNHGAALSPRQLKDTL